MSEDTLLPCHLNQLHPLEPKWMVKEASAVCMLFLSGEDHPHETQVLLLKRSTKVSSHRGQVGFPGGHREPDDSSPLETALRELHEETGIKPELVRCVGQLPMVQALSGAPVVPIVACAQIQWGDWQAQPSEVESIFTVPWQQLTRARSTAFEFTMFGRRRHSQHFDVQPYPIWGLTAKIIFDADLKYPNHC